MFAVFNDLLSVGLTLTSKTVYRACVVLWKGEEKEKTTTTAAKDNISTERLSASDRTTAPHEHCSFYSQWVSMSVWFVCVCVSSAHNTWFLYTLRCANSVFQSSLVKLCARVLVFFSFHIVVSVVCFLFHFSFCPLFSFCVLCFASTSKYIEIVAVCLCYILISVFIKQLLIQSSSQLDGTVFVFVNVYYFFLKKKKKQ